MRLFLFTLGFCSFLSCGKEDDTAAKQLEADILIINEYLAAKGLSAQKTASGLHYIITDQGNGLNYPNASSYVTVAYRGYFPNGVVFDQSTVGDPPSFFLNQVIKGWKEGIPLFRKGGKGVLLIPSALAYGPNPSSAQIPANAVMIFDIELVDFQ
ncbi:MAG: FKBP-type peptidyl-prolyl cis-trans isomerase [Saprospiraceae bacterium]|jgi:FKBP-type peptidyl-prolyl cis-trans isomerase FkpA|nr:FKBP-type peptidyl-prolyl cis-trans isomerase [Saprospiraceae bacterium]